MTDRTEFCQACGEACYWQSMHTIKVCAVAMFERRARVCHKCVEKFVTKVRVFLRETHSTGEKPC